MKFKKLLFVTVVAITAILMLTVSASATGFIRGDFDADGDLDADDAVYLLYHLYLPDDFPASQPVDINGDGKENTEDALYLLYGILLPDSYPFAECIQHIPVNVPAIEPSCLGAGSTEGSYCKTCGITLVETTPVSALIHERSSVTDIVSPTCDKDGYSLIYCAVCDSNFKSDFIPSSGHYFGEEQIIQVPTCTESGVSEQECTLCGDKITKELFPAGHEYSVDESGNSVCTVCSHTVAAEQNIPDEVPCLRDCPSDFSFTVETDKGEKHIYDNLVIRNIAAEKDDPDGKITFEIVALGGGKYEIIPESNYTEGTTYSAQASEDIKITESGGSSLGFKIDSEPHSSSKYSKNLIFITLPDVENEERKGYVVAPDIDKELLYLTLPSRGTVTSEYVGKLICAGGYSNTDELDADPTKECYFGRVEEVYFAENGACTLTLSCPTLGEIYEDLDFSDSYEIDFDTLGVEDALVESAVSAMYESESFAEFLATIQTAGNMYAKEKQLYAASIFDGFSIVPSVTTYGKSAIVKIAGSVSMDLKDSGGKKQGVIEVNFNTSTTLSFSVNADYSIKFLKVRDFDFNVVQKTDFTFDFGLEIKLNEYKSKPDSKKLYLTSLGKVHVESCPMISSKDKDKLTSLSTEDLMEMYAFKNGYIEDECHLCNPYTHYLDRTVFAVNEETGTVHRFSCSTSDRLAAEATASSIPSGKKNCTSCSPQEMEEHSFTAHMLNSLEYNDWSTSLSSVKDYLKNSPVKDKQTNTKEIKEFKFYIGKIAVGIKLNLIFEIYFEGAIDYSYSVSSTYVYGLRLEDGGLRAYRELNKTDKPSSFDLVGKASASVCLETYVYVSFTGLEWLVNAGIAIDIGAYADLSGVIHIPYDSADDNLYTAAYFEAGLFTNLSFKYTIGFWDGKISLIGGKKKSPLIKAGYDKVYYDFYGENSELDVHGKTVDLDDYDLLKVKYYSAKSNSGGKDLLSLDGKDGLYSVNITLLDTNGKPSTYGTLNGSVITLSKDVPCDATVVVKISIDGNAKAISTVKDFFENEYKTGNMKYDLDDLYITVHFSNHKYSEFQTTIEPTCTEDGLEQSFPLCQCTEIFENVLPALGHEKAKINAVAATCTTDGHTEEVYCSRCGEIFTKRTILPAFGHKYSVEYTCIDRPCQNPGCSYVSPASTPHNYSDWAEVPASGCALEAYQLRFCFDCSKIETDPADAYGSDHVHKPENVKYAEYIPPTCTEDGHYVLVCVACNVELLRESVPAIKEHNIGKNVPYVYDDESGHYKICAYDCGYKTEVTAHVFKNACDTSCEHCGYTKDPSAIKHKWEGMNDEDHHWDECSVCGVLKGEKEAHCGGVATCTNDGICSVCGYHYLDKLGHNLGEYVCTETHHYKVCQNDGCSYTAKRGVHKKPENAYPCFGDVKCTVCDYVITPFNGGCVADTEHGLIQDSINSVHYYRCVNGCPSQIDAEACYGGENACYTRNVCEKCGNKYGPYIDHLLEKDDNGYDKYYHDSENHWKICTRENCNVADKRILVGEHQPSRLDPKCTDAVKCKVCDLQLKEKGEHEWCETPVYQAALDKHMYVCGKCSVKRFESCRGGEANCTTPAVCELCHSYYGSALGHDPGGYYSNDTFHWQMCKRENCTSENNVINLAAHIPDPEANSCTEDVKCTVCDRILTPTLGGHKWGEYLRADSEKHVRSCENCGTKETERCSGGNNVCGERNLCDLCGTEYRDPVAHDLGNGNYSYDAFDHWQVCQRENCPAEGGMVNVEAHIPDPQENTCVEDVYCIVCGYLCREKLDGHAWSQYENVSDGTHRRRCDLCGATETGDCYGGENVCGSKNICKACNTEYGAVIEHDTGDDEYSFSESSHWLICRRESCPYADGIIDFAPHVPDPDTNSCVDDVKCTVCGYVTTPSRGGHTPSDTCIGTDSESTHKTECEYCSELLTEDCYGGENICGKKNICEGCGHEYGEVVEHLANEYCNDDSYHWAICIRPACPLADGIFGKEEHVYDDSLPVCEIDKICTVCGYFSESAPGHSPAEIPVCGTGSNSAYHFYVCTNEGCDYPGQREEHVFDRAVEAPEYLCANASCSHGAVYYYSCICGKSAGDNNSLVDTGDRFTVGAGLDHSYIYSPDSDGTHHWTYKCSMCGDILDKEEHYGGENTCTEKAVCEFCGEKYGTTLPHSYIYAIEDEKYAVREAVGGEVVVKTVSCERDGEYWYSCICGKSGGSEEDENLRPGTFTVEAYGHDPSGEIIPVYFNGKGCHYQRCLICDDVDWSVEDHFGGSNVCGQKNACDACGVLYGEKIEHLPDIEGYHVEADRHYKVCLRANCSCDNNLYEVGVHRYNAAPYCTKDRVCIVCGYLAEYAQGHSLELTGDENGHRYVCVAPGCDYKEEVLPHNYGEPVFSPDLDEHICRYSYTCSDCGYVHYEEVDHQYPETEITLVKEDIYVEEEGVTVYLIRICKECLSCGHLLEIGQSSDHAHSDIRLSDHVYPGCTVPGHTAGAFCAVEGCGFVYVEEESIDPLGHDYVNGICRRCGENEPNSEINYSQGLAFTLSSDGSYYIVSGIGTCTDLDVRIPPTYEGKPVKEISNYAFFDCSNLTSIDIPDGVTRIGDYAFSGCSSLTSIDIPDGVTYIGDGAFNWCSSLTSIDIPDRVTYIGDYAFYGCSSLTSIDIPDGVTYIADYAFYGCSSLTSIDIPDGVTYIGDLAFANCFNLSNINIPNKVTSIGNGTFYGCSNLSYIEIPGQVMELGQEAFYGCINLNKVVFCNNNELTTIRQRAFWSCISLTSINIPDSVVLIEPGAFNNCTSLTEISFGNNSVLSRINGFSGCTSLEKIVFPDALTSIGDFTFSDCTSLSSIIITDNITEICIGAFRNCDSLESVIFEKTNLWWYSHLPGATSGTNIPVADLADPAKAAEYLKSTYIERYWYRTNTTEDDNLYSHGLEFTLSSDESCYIVSGIGTCTDLDVKIPPTYEGKPVKEIGDSAFYLCSSLTSIDIPDGVTSIGDYALYGCSSLTSINIPDGVTYIGESAFYWCNSLTSVVFHSPEGWWIATDSSAESGTSISASDLADPAKAAEYLKSTYCDYYWNHTEMTEDDSNYSQGLEFTLSSDGSYYIVSGIGTCTDLDVRIPPTHEGKPVKEIGSWALDKYQNLTSVNIPAIVTYIGDGAFYGCTGLTSIDIPDGVTNIGDYAFESCSSLTSIDIPDGVTKIGDWTFSGCSNLTNINIPDGVTRIGEYAFECCSSLTSIDIPDGVTKIGDWTFSGCSNLTNINIPDGVTRIGEYAFERCSSLTSIDIPDSVTNIGMSAFKYCSKLSLVIFDNPDGWWIATDSSAESGTSISASDLADPAKAAEYLKSTYCDYYWNHTEMTEDDSNYSQGLEFTLSSDESYYIVFGIGTCTDLDVRIPPSHEGKPVKEIGYSAFYWCSSLTSIDIPDGVTSIGDYAFYDCSSLTSIDIPDGVTYIADYAFYGCSNLSNIDIPDKVIYIGDSAFGSCSNLESIAIPYGVTHINDSVFGGCSKLTSIDIPDGVTYIGNRAFSGCSSLTSIDIPDGVTYIGDGAFQGCSSLTSIDIPDGVTAINDYTFHFCSSISNIEIPANVTYIGISAFSYSPKLESITIPANVTDIGTAAFEKCSSLISVNFDESCAITIISDWAFDDCPNLISINIPEKVEFIGEHAFYGCSSLASINIPDRVTYIGESAFSGCTALMNINIPDGVTNIRNLTFFECWSLTNINIPDGVTCIGNQAFSRCSSLTSIDIPDYVTSIGSGAFSGCSNLTSINIPDYVTSIGSGTFSGCSNLTSINIPDYVTSIGSGAFSECSNLTDVNLSNNSILNSIGSRAFYDCSSLANVGIPDSVTYVGNYAFGYCVNLNSVSFSNKLKFIGKEAFKNSGVTSIIFTDTEGWKYTDDYLDLNGTLISTDILKEPAQAAENLKGSLCGYYLIRNGNSPEGSQGLEYILNPENGLTVVGIGSCSDNDIVIPESYNGLPITSIGDSAFYGCSNLTSIDIPDSIKSIGQHAFYGCSNLTSIVIPSEITYIGYYAFYDCNNLISVEVKNCNGWYLTSYYHPGEISLVESYLADPATTAKYLTSTYCNYFWHRS